LRGTDAFGLHYLQLDTLELLEIVRAESEVKVAYDIGAHKGAWTTLAKAIWPASRIEAFEPLPDHATMFRARLGSDSLITVHEVALGSTEEVGELRVTNFSDSSSFLPITSRATDHYGLTSHSIARVRVVDLDGYVERLGLPSPDLIKIDVQGFELVALAGGIKTMGSASHVLAEVSFVPLYEGQALFEDVVAFMAAHGFSLEAFSVGTPLGQPIVQTDVLFSRRYGKSSALRVEKS
jgi:FkbM family methyltransferase